MPLICFKRTSPQILFNTFFGRIRYGIAIVKITDIASNHFQPIIQNIAYLCIVIHILNTLNTIIAILYYDTVKYF